MRASPGWSPHLDPAAFAGTPHRFVQPPHHHFVSRRRFFFRCVESFGRWRSHSASSSTQSFFSFSTCVHRRRHALAAAGCGVRGPYARQRCGRSVIGERVRRAGAARGADSPPPVSAAPLIRSSRARGIISCTHQQLHPLTCASPFAHRRPAGSSAGGCPGLASTLLHSTTLLY